MNQREVRNKQRHVAETGDLIGLYGDSIKEFGLAIALDMNRAVQIFNNATGIRIDIIRIMIKNKQILSTIVFNDEIILEKLTKSEYEVYSTNIYTTPIKYDKTLSDFFDILRQNLQLIQQLAVGDIVKMKGLKIFDKFALYHHHVIFSDSKRFKIIHKWGEPTRSELFQSFMGDKSISYAEVREDNILEVACCREIEKENHYDVEHKDKIRMQEEIIKAARARFGETSYDLLTDNCQHFCTMCRYGIPLAIEIENTKKAVKYSAFGAIVAGTLAGIAIKYYTSRQSPINESQTANNEKQKSEVEL